MPDMIRFRSNLNRVIYYSTLPKPGPCHPIELRIRIGQIPPLESIPKERQQSNGVYFPHQTLTHPHCHPFLWNNLYIQTNTHTHTHNGSFSHYLSLKHVSIDDIERRTLIHFNTCQILGNTTKISITSTNFLNPVNP